MLMRPPTDLHGYCCSMQYLLNFKFYCKFNCKFYFTCDQSLRNSVNSDDDDTTFNDARFTDVAVLL